MASNITGQLLGLISAGSAFMGSARREAAMSEKRYETKENAKKVAEQKQMAAEQKAAEKAEAAKKKEAEKALKKEQKEIEDTAKAENRIAGREAIREEKDKEKAIKQDQKEQLEVAKAENRIAGQEAAREARKIERQQIEQDRENKHQQRRQEAMEDFGKKQGIKADTAQKIATKKSEIKLDEEDLSGKTAARTALATKREAESRVLSAQADLYNSMSKKAHAQKIAEANAEYLAQQSQEQHSAQKEVVQTLLKDTKNIK